MSAIPPVKPGVMIMSREEASINKRIFSSRFFLACCAALVFSIALPLHDISAEEKSEKCIIRKTVVAGASMSAGFALLLETAVPVTFADVLEKVFRSPHERITCAADIMFFSHPETSAAEIVAAIRKRNPTLVVAPDFLFWFGYGRVDREEERLTRLARGLSYLEQLSCPVVVGDFPDMSAAAGGILHPRQVPAPDMLSRLNKKVAKWCNEKKDRMLFPLNTFQEKIKADKGVKVGECNWSAGTASELLQGDRLHPSLTGTACAAVLVAETLLQNRRSLSKDMFLLHPRRIRDALRIKLPRGRKKN